MLSLAGLCLFSLLIALSVSDYRRYILPDILSLPLIGIGLASAPLLQTHFIHQLIGAVLGYTVFASFEICFRRLRGKDGLGRGDAKLLAAGGAWCGWAGLPFIVLIASGAALLALLVPSLRAKASSSKQNHIPFGPFLAFGIACVWLAFHMSGYHLYAP